MAHEEAKVYVISLHRDKLLSGYTFLILSKGSVGVLPIRTQNIFAPSTLIFLSFTSRVCAWSPIKFITSVNERTLFYKNDSPSNLAYTVQPFLIGITFSL